MRGNLFVKFKMPKLHQSSKKIFQNIKTHTIVSRVESIRLSLISGFFLLIYNPRFLKYYKYMQSQNYRSLTHRYMSENI